MLLINNIYLTKTCYDFIHTHIHNYFNTFWFLRARALDYYYEWALRKIFYVVKGVSPRVLRVSAWSIFAHTRKYTRVWEIQFAASFCKTCTGNDSRTTWRNYATNWSTPTLPSLLLPPWLPSACSCIALERRQLYRWPWSSWRDHTRGLAVSSTVPACCLRNTFDVLRNVSPPVAYIVAPRVQLGSSLKERYLSRCEVILAFLLMKWISTEFYDIVVKISNIFGSKKF